MHVVIADDDKDCVDILSEAISEVCPDAFVKSAANGEKLMRLLKKESEQMPDVIFLDIDMPCKNGLECLEEIRYDAKWQNVPVVIHTTSSNRIEIDEAFKNGADLYLPKSGSYTELKQLLTRGFQNDWGKGTLGGQKNFELSLTATHQV